VGSNRDGRHAEKLAQEHRRLADSERYDELLFNVRRCPGFERFFLPKELSALTPASHNCPVVVVNIDELRCDALILRNINGSPHLDHFPLVLASLGKIREAQDNLKDISAHGDMRQYELVADDDVQTAIQT
jgi:hypothetical protein